MILNDIELRKTLNMLMKECSHHRSCHKSCPYEENNLVEWICELIIPEEYNDVSVCMKALKNENLRRKLDKI